MKKRNFLRIIVMAFLFLCLFALSRAAEIHADENTAGAITVKDIDYEALTMKVMKNGNTKVYYSATMASDLSSWDEISGSTIGTGSEAYILMDISWASSASDVSFYLRGDVNRTAVNVKLPKSSSAFKVSFNKVDGDFSFTGNEGTQYFFYRKSSDYNWIKVYFKDGGGSPAQGTNEITYAEFLQNVEALRFKGAKLIFKLGQTVGSDLDHMGARPGKEVTVTIAKYTSAPSLKINVLKLTVNTKTTMEWTDDLNGRWHECEKNMDLAQLAASAFLSEGSRSGSEPKTLYFRVAATEKKPCSQITVLTVPAQTEAPSISAKEGGDVVYSYENNKLILNFADASATKPYEYCVVPAGSEFDASKAKWKTVKSAKSVSLTAKSADGATIYVRFKGLSENVKKNIPLTLPSAYSSFVANGFEKK